MDGIHRRTLKEAGVFVKWTSLTILIRRKEREILRYGINQALRVGAITHEPT